MLFMLMSLCAFHAFHITLYHMLSHADAAYFKHIQREKREKVRESEEN